MTKFKTWLAFGVVGMIALPASAAPVPFGPGERLGMEVRYLGMHVGEFDIQVDDASTSTRALWPVTFNARSRGLFDTLYSVRENFVSLFDPETRRSLESVEKSHTGSWKTETKIRFVGDKALVDRTLNGERSERVVDVPAATHDILSAIYHLRTLDLRWDARHIVPVFSGKQSWMLEARVTGRETVKTKVGTFDTWVVQCKTHLDGKLATDRDITLWLSTDERRVLVRVEGDVAVGALKVDLVAYEPPASTRDTPKQARRD